jgi:hypothetical protein
MNMNLVEVLASELKVGDKVRIAGGDCRVISFIGLTKTGHWVNYQFETNTYKSRLKATTKVGIYK